jgi:DNA-binding CsgD family transcriptional regulator
MRRPEAPRFVYDEHVMRRLIESDAWRGVIADLRLSPRQRGVLESFLLVDTDALVAERLCISPRTVEAHVHAMCRKAGVRSRTQLLATVIGAAVARITGDRSTPSPAMPPPLNSSIVGLTYGFSPMGKIRTCDAHLQQLSSAPRWVEGGRLEWWGRGRCVTRDATLHSRRLRSPGRPWRPARPRSSTAGAPDAGRHSQDRQTSAYAC